VPIDITLFRQVCMLGKVGNEPNSIQIFTMFIRIVKHYIDIFRLKTRVKQCIDMIIVERLIATA
jgi:hypothetical protein